METLPNDNTTKDSLRSISRFLYRYGLLCVYVVGCLGNALSVFLFTRKSWRKNVCVFYFRVILFLNTIYLNSTILGTMLSQGYSINRQNSHNILCKLFFYTIMVVSSLLPSVLMLASIDRLLISSQNVNTRLYSSKRLAYFSISVSSVFWTLFNIHILIKVSVQQPFPSNIICYYELTGWYLNFVTYFLMISNTFFCVSMIILSAVSLRNVRHIRLVPRHKRKELRSMTRKDFQLLRCLFILNMAHVSTSIIASVYSIYKTAVRDYPKTATQAAIIDFVENTANFIYFSYYSMTFFIFLSVSKVFRLQLIAICKGVFVGNVPQIPEDEQVPNESNVADALENT